MYEESLASNAFCLYQNEGANLYCEFICKLSFSQLIGIRDYILSGHSHFNNKTQDIILSSIRAVLLNDLNICPELEDYLRRYI